MKKLILHIGYPKTASTSLQEGLFLPLHNDGKINFLGRTVTSTHKKIFERGFRQDWVVGFRKHFIMGKKLPHKNYILSDRLLNVISDEDLTLPAILNEIQFGLKKDPLTFIHPLKQILSDADQVIILMTIRNQAELIYSCYSQKFRYIYLYRPDFSFKSFIRNPDNSFNPDTFRAFNFLGIAEEYAKVFNARVIPIFFEDLKYDKDHFFEKLATIMELQVSELIEMLGSSHYRNKKVNGIDNTKTFLSPNYYGKLLARLLGKKRSRHFFSFHWYMRNSFFLSWQKSLLLTKTRVPITPLDEASKEFIKDSFSSTNQLFCEKFGMEIEKFKKYNYL